MKEALAYLSPFLLVAAGVLAWLYQHERERRAEIEKQLSEAKYKTYIALINLFFDQTCLVLKKFAMLSHIDFGEGRVW
jgi:hypothetical protein